MAIHALPLEDAEIDSLIVSYYARPHMFDPCTSRLIATLEDLRGKLDLAIDAVRTLREGFPVEPVAGGPNA